MSNATSTFKSLSDNKINKIKKIKYAEEEDNTDEHVTDM